MRKLPALIAAAGLLVSLSACASSPSASSCTPEFTSGSNSALVTTTGSLGGDPKATFPTPLVATKSEVSVPIVGDGRLVNVGDTAVIQISLYAGKTGYPIATTTGSTATGIAQLATSTTPAFGAVTQCTKVNSRTVSVGTAGNLLGPNTLQGLTTDGSTPLAVADTVVMIVDVQAQYLGRANGVSRPPQPGLPSIVLAPNGQPGFTFPAGNPPVDLRISTLKQGNGSTVSKGDKVFVNFTGVVWAAKSVFATSWTAGNQPAVWLATSLSEDPKGIIKGLAEALTGAQVGSQVLVVIPPSDGFPTGSEPAGVTAGSTLSYVVDILGIQGK